MSAGCWQWQHHYQTNMGSTTFLSYFGKKANAYISQNVPSKTFLYSLIGFATS